MDMNDMAIKFLDTVCESAEDVGRSFTEADDDWVPIMQTATPLGEEFIVYTFGFEGAMLANDRNKDLMAEQMMKPLITGTGAKLVALVMSAWTVKFEGEDAWNAYLSGNIPRPSAHPNRVEIVAITVIAPTKIMTRTAEILRDGTNPPTLGPWEHMESGEGIIVEGRFSANLQEALRDSSGKVDKKFMRLVFGEAA